jgi:20S proteasome alpha/beta subunit
MTIVNKPLNAKIKRLLAAQKDRSMTYIAAFRCQDGVVMCADTLQTEGDYKNYVEKLSIVEDRLYPLAIGGAGLGDLIDCVTNEVIERVKVERPKTKKELKTLLVASLAKVYKDDLPVLVVPRQLRSPEYLVAAKTDEGFVIFYIKGRRVLAETERAIVGYGTKNNVELLKRLHRSSLPIQQAVMLGVYLTSQSKKIDEGVGGDTRIAFVLDRGAFMEYPPYVANSEARVAEFLKMTDELFLSSVDSSIPPSAFPQVLEKFGRDVAQLRQKYLNQSASISFGRTLTEPMYAGEPYAKIFPGAVVEFGTGGINTRETTPEEKERNRMMWEAAKDGNNRLALAQFNALIEGKEILYIGKEPMQVRGTAGLVSSPEESASESGR